MRLTSGGALGIGTTSPTDGLHVYATSDTNYTLNLDGPYNGSSTNNYIAFSGNGTKALIGKLYRPTAGNAIRLDVNFADFIVGTGTGGTATERLRIDSSGRLLVGTSTALGTSTLVVQGIPSVTNPGIYLSRASNASTIVDGNTLGFIEYGSQDNGLGAQIVAVADGTWSSTSDCPTRLVFSTTADGASSPTERMRIDSTGRITGFTGGLEISRTVDSAAAVGSFISSSATTGNQYGLYVRLDGDPNNTGQYFLECYGGIDRRATIRSNGGLANYQSNNVDLSDQRTKRNIVPASSSWDCVQALEVVNFNYLDDDAGEAPRVGVIAQQVQQHCPEVVIPYQEAEDAVFDEDGNVVTPAMEERLGVREQQIMWMAIKALQEAQVRIEVLEAEVAALRAQ